MLSLPSPRGETSALLLGTLGPEVRGLPAAVPSVPADPLHDDDFQLALYLCYELHYRGLPGVDPEWEWEPSLLRLRRRLERRFMEALYEATDGGPEAQPSEVDPCEMDLALRAIEALDDGPSLSKYISSEASRDEVLEFLVHRSAYQLKEADPHSWALPRLFGAPKAAMVEIQADEYGGGRPERIHAQLFADTMDALGLDSSYGAYIEHIPGVTLATVNLMSLLGLHRRWRGAIVGHLALFEMTSSIPNGRYAKGLRRLGLHDATPFFDEHVEADAVHENLAAVDLAGGLVRQQPELTRDILFGARALVAVETAWASHVLDAWRAGASSLRIPLAQPLPAAS